MTSESFLYKKSVRINENIEIIIPTVAEVIESEESYYAAVTALTAMPIDMMVQLDDMGIDFSECSEYDLFLILSKSLKEADLSLVFGGFDFSKLKLAVNESNGLLVLRDEESGIVIDRAVHSQISGTLRKIHHLTKNRRKAGNDEAKKYMLKRAREKQRRERNKKQDSQLEKLIVALVNSEQFKYGFEDVKNLSIYQFNESVRQIIKKTDYNNRMYGIYSGTIDPKNLKQDDLNWLVH